MLYGLDFKYSTCRCETLEFTPLKTDRLMTRCLATWLMMAGPLYEIKPLQKQLFLIVKLFESDCYNIAFLTAERSISFYNF